MLGLRTVAAQSFRTRVSFSILFIDRTLLTFADVSAQAWRTSLERELKSSKASLSNSD
jgi:hypothetical protein